MPTILSALRHRRRAFVRACACAVLCLAAVGTLHAADSDERSLERRVKAAFIYRFTEFITWPEPVSPAGQPFIIGVVGSDDLVEELRRVTASRSVGGRPVEIRRVEEARMPAVHMLFVPDSERTRLAQWIRAAPRGSVVITESEGALAAGSVINFVIVDGRVRFEISADAADKRGVRLSSRLLALAQNVRSGAP